jgi:hypothetical protein
MVLMMMGM